MVQNKIPFKKFWPGIAWFLFTSVLVFLPGSDIPESSWLDVIYFDKFVHAGIFGGLTLLFCLPFFKAHFNLQQKINYFIRISLAAIFWGIIVEVVQKFFIPGRSFDMFDWAADSVGVYIGFLVSKRIIKHLASKKAGEM
jgi:VanZ family protein